MFTWIKDKVYSFLGLSVKSTENVVEKMTAVPKAVNFNTLAVIAIGACVVYVVTKNR